MLTSNFKNIDANQIATDRQVYGVACHFAAIHAKSPSERYGLTKVFNAVVKKYYSDADSFMTHGDVSEFREWDCVPEQFLLLVANKKPKVKAKPKAEAKPKPVAKKAKPKAAATKETLTSRVDSLEAKMDKILEILSAK
jgi:hypothetical protein|tara:strand:+ start:282 stop:698 length:417 start_codon:yes stop_codon:yes gene_type:complete